MSSLVYTVRRFVPSNLGWFHETRTVIGEATGRERAININRPVIDAWFPGGLPPEASRIHIIERHLAPSNSGLAVEIMVDPKRPIALQGADKNWRLAGDAVPGQFYGTLRENDLMIMVFDREQNTLSWFCVRGDENEPPRLVPDAERGAYHNVLKALGAPNADRNMWLPSPSTAAKILSEIRGLHPAAADLLLEQQLFLDQWKEAVGKLGLISSEAVLQSLPLALQAKPFLILTGLSGSGKTLIARAFARWLCEGAIQYALVPVGADWISSENIIGYMDALDVGRYVKRTALQLMLEASKLPNQHRPYFLILDEMNLSHVERYFSDVLSAIESGEDIPLHDRVIDVDGVPNALRLPPNLFVIGTVNIDETTYLFSPKVLDRANVIECRVSSSDILQYIEHQRSVDIHQIERTGASLGGALVHNSKRSVALLPRDQKMLKDELRVFFAVLEQHGYEFGYRTIKEITRFMYFYRQRYSDGWPFAEALDLQVKQKLLPKLNGSQKRLEPLLSGLAVLCFHKRTWNATGDLANADELVKQARDIGRSGGVGWLDPVDGSPTLPISYDKIIRMLNRVRENGFVSFAEV